MALTFQSDNHSYKSIDPKDTTEWLSVTSLVGLFKPKFDAIAVSEKVCKNKKSKWYGMAPAKIREVWENEAKRATDLGTWFHNEREIELTSSLTLERSGVHLPIIKPLYNGDIKLAPDQKLTEGIYPEHFAYLKSAGVCGQSDRVEVVKNVVDIIDYKTNKEIKKEGFRNWQGVVQKMTGPLSHLDDCSFYHYAVQLSVYMYMIIKHNHNLKPGKLTLHHITFEEEGVDEYGYPVAKRNAQGEPIVKELVPYEVPYLKSEVISIINWLHDNRQNIKKKH
jgi:hypothetical protein